MALWFRMYEGTLDDPKVQKLPPKMFKAWINLLCLASRHDGEIPEASVIAFALRISEVEATDIFAFLFNSGLFDRDEDGRVTPHNWASRQFKSDVSNERVKRHRQRQRNVTETPSESEQIQSRTDSVANATGGTRPPRDVIFAEGLPWLMRRSAKSRDACAKMIGHWLKETGDDDQAVLDAMQAAEQENPADPFPWIAARLKPKEARETWNQRRIREATEAIRQ